MNEQYDDRHDNQSNDSDAHLDRFGRQLRAAAGEVPLRPGSELATVRTAHRRRHRRRNLAAGATVVAVAGGTAVAIQQLGKTSPDTIGTADEPGGSGSDVALAPAAPATTMVMPPPATTPVADPYAAIADQLVPAQPAESNYVWNVVTPEAANAVYGRFDGTVPGVIVSTAPGRREDDGPRERVLYYTDDGISYERLDVAPPSGLLRHVVTQGDEIYNVGTAPGIAATSPNHVVVEYSADRGATWETAQLPIDMHATRDLPMLTEQWQLVSAPVDGGVVVVAQRHTGLDERDLPDPVAERSHGYTPEGLEVADDTCAGPTTASTTPTTSSTTTTVVSGTDTTTTSILAPSAVPPVTAAMTESDLAGADGACGTSIVSWDELGVPRETVDALFGGMAARAFRVIDGAVTELDLPAGVDIMQPAGMMHPAGTPARFAGYSNRGTAADESYIGEYEVSSDGTFVPVAATEVNPLVRGQRRESSATREFVDLGPTNGREAILASTADGSNWTYTDTNALYSDVEFSSHGWGAASDDAYVAATMIHRDAMAERGGVSIEADGIVLERSSSRSPIVARDAATGDVIAENVGVEWMETEGGEMEIVTRGLPDGLDPGFTTAQSEELYGGGTTDSPRWAIETTTDGLHVATESVAELLGVTDDEVSSISRITTIGRNVIVAVTMQAENPDGTNVQQVLVGTPKA